MPKWYTYEKLKEVKEATCGLKNLYGVVDEIVDRNKGCTHLRLWDRTDTVVIRLFGNVVHDVQKGDIVRVHRLQRQTQGDSFGTIGHGVLGGTCQMVVWREKEGGYSVVASSSSKSYTRNDNDEEVVTNLYTSWKKDNAQETNRDSDNSSLDDSFLNDTVIHVGSLDECSLNADSQQADKRLDYLLEESTIDHEVDANRTTGNRNPHDNNENALNEADCSLRIDSQMAGNNLDDILNDTTMDAPIQEVDPIPDPPPLTVDQSERLKKAVSLSGLTQYTYYDVRLQVVDAYYESNPCLHMVVRCWDPHSTIPTYDKSIRHHCRLGDYQNRLMIMPNKSILDASSGQTIDIYCYDYDRHVGDDGRNIQSGHWLVFFNLKVGYTTSGNYSETVFNMHSGGQKFGRCIRRIPFNEEIERGGRGTEREGEESRQERSPRARGIEAWNDLVKKKEKKEKEQNEEKVKKLSEWNKVIEKRAMEDREKELRLRLDTLCNFNKRDDENASEQEENELMVPRGKKITPYLKWNRYNIPDGVTEYPSLTRMNCNCGLPSNQCPCPRPSVERHKYFYRNRIFPSKTFNHSSLFEGMSLNNEFLPSLSFLSEKEAPTTFNLMAQMTSLCVQRGSYKGPGIPPCHISIVDGSVPPERIRGERLLRDLFVENVDKCVIGKRNQSSMEVDVRLGTAAKVKKEGVFVILRDVTIVRAYSEGGEDGSLSPVWMLQARGMELFNDQDMSPEVARAEEELVKRLLLHEGKEMIEDKRRVRGLKRSGDEPTKRMKRIRLDHVEVEKPKEQTWMDELSEKAEKGIESQDETTFTLTSSSGVIKPPIFKFESFDQQLDMYKELMEALSNKREDISRKGWICWMKTCTNFNTIKEREEAGDSCCERCDGGINQYAYIPIDSSLPSNGSRTLHLLVETSHFRKDNTIISPTYWLRSSSEDKKKEVRNIIHEINKSSLSVRRVRMMYLHATIAFVIFPGKEWATLS